MQESDIAKQGVGLPPINFVFLKAKYNKEVATVEIYTSHKVKEEFTKYSIGNTKLTIA